MLLDDMRDVFSVALLTLGYSVNDSNPKHIEQAYLKMRALLPNIKIFSTDAVPNIFIDEDATIGMAWSGDCKSAQDENSRIQYIYPRDGFVIWIDSIAIVNNAPHFDNAHKFIDFILRPDIAKKINLYVPYSSPNLAAVKLLPLKMQQSRMINPDAETLKRGQVQLDIDEKTLHLYSDYWEKLKIGE